MQRIGRRTITVHVGTEDKKATFDVYEDLLVRHSDFFSAALSKNWKEEERTVSLPEDRAAYFEVFFHFVNTGSIFSVREGDECKDEGGKDCDKEWARLIKCWILGQKLLSLTFKDAIVDAIVAKMQGHEHCNDLYTSPFKYNTPSTVLRKLLADIVVYMWPDEEFEEQSENMSKYPEHLMDVAKALHKVKLTGYPTTKPWGKDDCTYHEHVASGKPCYKTMF